MVRGRSGEPAVTQRASVLPDAVRLAIGTLTVLPVRAPRRVEPDVAGWAMALAPLVGALLALAGGALLWALGLTDADPLLAAALTVGLLALLTRAMHLDGLADTADGLGSGKAAPAALDVMRRGDVGPFGVVTLLLVLLVQVVALAALVRGGSASAGLLVALVVSRLALPLLCLRGVPAARADGLGRVVAGSVGPARLGTALALAVVLLVVPTLVVGPAGSAVPTAAACVVGPAVGGLVALRAVRRLGGITGDVLGAAVEAAFTAALVVLALSSP